MEWWSWAYGKTPQKEANVSRTLPGRSAAPSLRLFVFHISARCHLRLLVPGTARLEVATVVCVPSAAFAIEVATALRMPNVPVCVDCPLCCIETSKCLRCQFFPLVIKRMLCACFFLFYWGTSLLMCLKRLREGCVLILTWRTEYDFLHSFVHPSSICDIELRLGDSIGWEGLLSYEDYQDRVTQQMLGLMTWWCATLSEAYSKDLILLKLRKNFKRKIEECHCHGLYPNKALLWVCICSNNLE